LLIKVTLKCWKYKWINIYICLQL